jgi:DNA helicase-2/ATP-dependent DNA helicase PcrA
LTDQDKNKDNEECIKLMTIHASKGLEFKSVFLVGMEERLFPSERSSYSLEDLEEERRLFYVAVTRAERFLTMSFSTSRYKFGKIDMCEPSRFLSELPKEILDIQFTTSEQNETTSNPSNPILKNYQRNNQLVNTIKSTNNIQKIPTDFKPDHPDKLEVGMRVMHQNFGEGNIVGIDGDADKKVASIMFGGTERRIMLKFAKLQIL